MEAVPKRPSCNSFPSRDCFGTGISLSFVADHEATLTDGAQKFKCNTCPTKLEERPVQSPLKKCGPTQAPQLPSFHLPSSACPLTRRARLPCQVCHLYPPNLDGLPLDCWISSFSSCYPPGARHACISIGGANVPIPFSHFRTRVLDCEALTDVLGEPYGWH